jgi:uncharacterized protein (DUF58 family)
MDDRRGAARDFRGRHSIDPNLSVQTPKAMAHRLSEHFTIARMDRRVHRRLCGVNRMSVLWPNRLRGRRRRHGIVGRLGRGNCVASSTPASVNRKGVIMQTLWFDREYLPFLRPYFQWTHQPLAWLILAAISTLLFGLANQPAMIWLAFGIVCFVLLGIFWPWMVLRGVDCRLRFSQERTTEGDTVDVMATITNRWPWPLPGLAIEGGFIGRGRKDVNADDEPPVDVALALIAARSQSNFTWKWRPPRRGIYPKNTMHLTTGFPFGLWRPRRKIAVEGRLLAWPRRFAIPSSNIDRGVALHGLDPADSRPGDSGDVLGVRPFRSGDSLRRVHWTQTAKHDRLIVCERQSSVRPCVRIVADLENDAAADSGNEQLEQTIRTAASLCESLHRRRTEIEYCDAQTVIHIDVDPRGLQQLLDHFATIPELGLPANVLVGSGVRQMGQRREMLEIYVTTADGMATRPPCLSKTTSPRRFLFAGETPSILKQWEAICHGV